VTLPRRRRAAAVCAAALLAAGACSSDDHRSTIVPTTRSGGGSAETASDAEGGGSGGSGGSAIELRPLHAESGDDPRIVDDLGRQVLLRGVNLNSLGDYYQGDPDAEPVVPVTDDDWSDMAAHGFGVVRLLVSWSRLEPQRSQYDEDYIAEIVDAVDTAAAHGLYTVVDMHQDAWGKYTASPAGATCPAGGEPAIGWDGAPEWATLSGGASTCTFGSRESAPAVVAAWDAFYADTEGIRTRLAFTWAHLVEALGDRASVAGYDLLNEPNNGSDSDASLVALGEFYDATIQAIRAAERNAGAPQGGRVAFFETSVTGFPVAPGFTADTNIAFAPHNYGESIGPIPIEATFEYFRSLAEGYRAPLWIGEYGFFEDTDAASEKLTRYAAKEDALVTVGGAWWQWRQACGDPHSVSKPGGTAAPVQIHLRTNRCPGDVDGGVNPRWACLWRPYPRFTPGTITEVTSTCDGSLKYRGTTERSGELVLWVPGDAEPEVGGDGLTDVSATAVDGGYLVTATAAGAYRVTATAGR